MEVVTVESLPDTVILHVLSYLSTKDLLATARICRRWKRISCDRSLWKHVDLSLYMLSLQHLRSLMKAHFSEALQSLQLKGYLEPDKVSSWKKNSLSCSVMQELGELCPNLQDLSISHTDFKCMNIDSLPSSVRKLSIRHSLIPIDWFRPLQQDGNILPHLWSLDLSYSNISDVAVILIVTARPHLTSLKLNGCYRVNDEGLKAIADNLKLLVTLELDETNCSDMAVHHICRGLKGLRRFSLSQCDLINDSSLLTISLALRRLCSFKLRGCGKLTDAGLRSLTQLRDSVQELDLRSTDLTQETLTALTIAMPSCRIRTDLADTS